MMGASLDYVLQMLRSWPVYRKYRDSTMLPEIQYVENIAIIRMALKSSALVNGAVIECGTWKGGMSAGLIEAAGPFRRYIFFDSFEGLPPPQEIDGKSAIEWQSRPIASRRYGNCAASIDDFWMTISKTGCSASQIEVQKGFFEDTLAGFDPPPIAILRLDGDWYSSTVICLEKFWGSVMPGGVILLDDYYTWDGCARAVHDFLSARKASERIRQGPLGRIAYIRRASN